nr:putative ABC transporter permease [uncultured Solibaculum sp.]
MTHTIFGYPLSQLIFYFAFYSIVGWVLECIYCSIGQRKVVNRGFLYGPWCPVYGFGAVALIVILSPLTSHPLLFVPLSILVTSVIEFITGWIFERVLHIKLWDYTGKFLSIKGYVCLKNSLIWGVLSALFVWFIHPQVEKIYLRLGSGVTYYGSLVILLVFSVDFLVSLIQSVKLSEHLRVLEERMQEARQMLDRLKNVNDGQKALLEKHAEKLRRLADQRIESTVKRFRLHLKAFPTMSSKTYPTSLKAAHEALKNRRRNRK